MAKLFRFVLIFLVLLLCGCLVQDDSVTIEQTHIGTTSVPMGAEHCTVVDLSINPQLEIYVDDENLIRAVVYKNDEARTALSGLAYEGLPFDFYLNAILDLCVQMGYLQDGGNVSLVVRGEVTPQQEQHLQQQMTDVLTAFAQTQRVSVSARIEMPGSGELSVTYEAVSTSSHTYEEYDDQGNLVAYCDVSEDGTTLEVLLDASGNPITEKLTNPDGSGHWISYNSHGLQDVFEDYAPGRLLITRRTRVYHTISPLHYTETDENGFSVEYKCDAAGGVIYSSYMGSQQTLCEEWYTDGNCVERCLTATEDDGTVVKQYFENQVQVSESRIQADGVQMEMLFENGLPALALWQDADGGTWQERYQNGVLSSQSGTTADGRVWSRSYAGGALVYSRTDEPDGSWWEERYEGGSKVYTGYYTAGLGMGSETTNTYNANGTLAMQSTRNADGSVLEVIHDGNGNPVSWKLTDAAGVQTQGGFNAVGQPID